MILIKNWQDNLNKIVKSILVICTQNSNFTPMLSKRSVDKNTTFKTCILKSQFFKTHIFKQLTQTNTTTITWSTCHNFLFLLDRKVVL